MTGNRVLEKGYIRQGLDTEGGEEGDAGVALNEVKQKEHTSERLLMQK